MAFRTQKSIKVDGFSVVVKELTTKEIRQFWDELNSFSVASLLSGDGVMRELWKTVIDGVLPENLDDMVPSEIKKIFDAFSEVNAVFFDMINKLGMKNPLLWILNRTIAQDLTNRYHTLSETDTQEQETTDTDSSSQLSES